MTTSVELWQPTPRSAINELKRWKVAVTEDGIIDFVASLSPWLAPLPSAVFVQNAAIKHLHSNDALSLIIAVVIETLGLTTTHTALAFHKWNRAHPDQPEKQAPYGLAVFLAVVYVAVTLVLIVVLESRPEFSPYAPIMFPLLAVVGAVNLAMRSHHNQRVREEKTVVDVERNRRYEIEDREIEFKHKLTEKRLDAKLKLTVNTVNTTVNTVIDSIDRHNGLEKANQVRLEKKIERQQKVKELLNQGKSVSDIVVLGIGSRNTIKSDVKEINL